VIEKYMHIFLGNWICTVIQLAFIGSGLALALMELRTLVVVSYSLTDPVFSTADKAKMAAVVVFLLLAVTLVAIRCFRGIFCGG
jgi:hypothetical protein